MCIDCVLIISIASVMISFVSAYYTIRVNYLKYLSKKEKILMIVTNGQLIDGIIRLSIVYSNVCYRQSVVASSRIVLQGGNSIMLNDKNHRVWMKPQFLHGKQQCWYEVEYNLQTMKIDSAMEILVITEYINSFGEKLFDECNVGIIGRNETGHAWIGVEHDIHELSTNKSLASCSLSQ